MQWRYRDRIPGRHCPFRETGSGAHGVCIRVAFLVRFLQPKGGGAKALSRFITSLSLSVQPDTIPSKYSWTYCASIYNPLYKTKTTPAARGKINSPVPWAPSELRWATALKTRQSPTVYCRYFVRHGLKIELLVCLEVSVKHCLRSF